MAVNAPSWKVRVRSLTSSVSAWLSALPARVTVTRVSLSRLTAMVSPAGTLAAVMCVPRVMGSANVSLERVAVILPVTLPSLSPASLKLADQLIPGVGAIIFIFGPNAEGL